MSSMQPINGVAGTLLDEARSRVANGTATDTDRLMLVMEALSNQNKEVFGSRAEFSVKLFGRNWTATEMVFGFGFLIAGETAFVAAEHAFKLF